jgi:competence protein ComEC
VNQLLIRLKTLLKYDYGYYLLIIISFSYAFYISNLNIKPINTTLISGTIKEVRSNYFIIDNYIIRKENNYKIDDYLLIKGYNKEISEARNFNLFDYKKYLKSKQVFSEFIVIKELKHISSNSIRSNIHNYIYSIDKEYLPLLILGINNDLDLDSYNVNGIIHLFSISGLHISIITNLLYFILMKKNTKTNLAIIILLLFYTYITNYKVSISRSFLLLFFSFLNSTLNINTKKINIFILSLSIALLLNPYNLLSIGFYFSYVITFFLIYFNKNKKEEYFINLIKTSMMCFLITIPILIYSYHSINLTTIINNIIFIPLVTVLYYVALLTLVIKNTTLLNNLTNYINDISVFLTSYKFELIFIKPPILVIFIYYLLIFLILNKKHNYIYLLLIMLIIHLNFRSLYNYPELHMIDVGQADSIIYTNRNFNVLFDTGNKQVVPYLKSIGISKLDYLVITHGDADHAKEALHIINNIKVNNVIFNSYNNNELEQEIINNIKIPYLNISKYKLNDHISFINDVYKNENEDSLITKININGYIILLMGDAYTKQEEKIDFKVDVLKVGHHGSKTSTSQSFIDKIKPDIALISVGHNYYGHPNKEVLDRLKNHYITKNKGTIKLIFKNNIEIKTKFQ